MIKRNISLFLAAVLVFSSTAGLLFLLLYFKSSRTRTMKTYPHMVSFFDTKNNVSKTGTAWLSKRVEGEGFVSFRSENDQYFATISEKTTNQFECTGVCYCDSEGYRRSVGISSRYLPFIVSALSIGMAANIAKQFFREQCQFSYQNDCQEEYVRSEIEGCEVFEIRKPVPDKERRYLCSGFCLPSSLIRHSIPLKVQNDFDCTALKLDGVLVTIPESQIPKEYLSPGRVYNNDARDYFRQKFLVPYCRDNSQFKYSTETKRRHRSVKGELIEYIYDEKKKVSLCQCTNSRGVKNIKCKHVH